MPDSLVPDSSMPDSLMIDIQVVLAMPEQQFLMRLAVPEGASARQAVELALQAGLIASCDIDIDPLSAPLGIYNERVDDHHVVQSGDRVEIYRPLRQDPMELRRQRAQMKDA